MYIIKVTTFLKIILSGNLSSASINILARSYLSMLIISLILSKTLLKLLLLRIKYFAQDVFQSFQPNQVNTDIAVLWTSNDHI